MAIKNILLLFAFTFCLTPACAGEYTGITNILFLSKNNHLPGNVVLTYGPYSPGSLACQAMLGDVFGFGGSSQEYIACQSYFNQGGSGTVSFWRLANGDGRARIFGGPLPKPCGSYGITEGSLTYRMNGLPATAGSLNSTGVSNCATLASTIEDAVNAPANLATASVIDATSVPRGPMTETWGLLTVGKVTSGKVGLSVITGENVPPHTGIIGNISGIGASSTWVVSENQVTENLNITNTILTQTGFSSQLTNNPSTGVVYNTLWIEPNNIETLETNTSFGGFPATTNASTTLGFTAAAGAKRGYATKVRTSGSLNVALSLYSGFTAVQWIGDVPPKLIADQTSAWCSSHSVTYLSP